MCPAPAIPRARTNLEHSVENALPRINAATARRISWLGLLLAITLLRGLIYATIIPPWQAPDEPGHFEYIRLLAQSPSLDQVRLDPELERELLASLYEWRFGELTRYSLPETMPERLKDLPPWIDVQRSRPALTGRFSLSYVWPTLLLLAARFQDIVVQLYIVRLSSVLINVAIVWLAFCTLSTLIPDRPKVVMLMTAVIVFLPQHTFINSSAGDGPFAELMATLVLYGWVYFFQRGFGFWALLAIVGGTVVGAWSKTTAAFWVPLDVALAVWWAWRQRRGAWSHWRTWFIVLLVLAAVTGLIIWVQSPTGLNVARTVQRSLLGGPLLLVDRRGLSVWEALLGAHDSFWGSFGWLTVPMGDRWYGALLLLTMLAAAGWLLGRAPIAHVDRWVPLLMAAVAGSAALIFVWVAILNSSSGYFQFQGRYLFPAVVPFAFLLVGGWLRLFPPKRQPVLAASGLLFLIVVDTWCIGGYLVPYFYS